MPTGYTAAVSDGTITTLKEFAYQCARGMGALVTMREAPWDTPIPERFEPSDYHRKELEGCQKELAALYRMNMAEAGARAKEDYDNQVIADQKRQAEINLTRERYDAMSARVEAWRGAPEGIKKFMLSQLRESSEADCPNEFYNEWRREPVRLTPNQWYEREEQRILKDISYASKHYAEELERTEERNKWLKQLRESLGDA